MTQVADFDSRRNPRFPDVEDRAASVRGVRPCRRNAAPYADGSARSQSPKTFQNGLNSSYFHAVSKAQNKAHAHASCNQYNTAQTTYTATHTSQQTTERARLKPKLWEKATSEFATYHPPPQLPIAARMRQQSTAREGHGRRACVSSRAGTC